MLFSALLSRFWLVQKTWLFPEASVATFGHTQVICTLEVKEFGTEGEALALHSIWVVETEAD